MLLFSFFKGLGASSEKILSGFFAKVSSLRENYIKRTQEINTLTENSVMGVTQHLSRIVTQAQQYLSKSKGALDDLNGEGNVNEVLTNQNELVTKYREAVETFIVQQQDLSKRAEESLQHITKAAKDIDRLANESQFLSLNARIEAGRLGKNGAGIAVIAGEMHRLNKSIEEANQFVNKLSSSLLEVLPKMGSTIQEMRSSSDDFAKELSSSTSRVESLAQSLYEMNCHFIKAGDQFSEQIIQDSHAALSHLQFQDVVAQGLMRIDRWIWEVQVECATGDAQGTIAPPIHIEVGGEKSIQQENHGEVMLF
jgi:methyl-accepting chemotaxis protein